MSGDPDGTSCRAPSPLVALPARVAVLLSGRGSNLEALARACEAGAVPARIVLAVSDRPEAAGLARAAEHGIPAAVVERPRGLGREEHETLVSELISREGADLVCLAGYMRVLSERFVARWPLRLLNIHPSLLPAFPGRDAQAQALTHGVRLSGATVHFVDAGVDSGPIVAQESVPVESGDDVEALAARILAVEHRLYPLALRRVLLGGWAISGRRVLLPEG